MKNFKSLTNFTFIVMFCFIFQTSINALPFDDCSSNGDLSVPNNVETMTSPAASAICCLTLTDGLASIPSSNSITVCVDHEDCEEDKTYMFFWKKASDPGTYYTGFKQDFTNCYTITGLSPNTEYDVEVRVYTSSCGWSLPFLRSYTTGISSSSSMMQDENMYNSISKNFNIYPNPTKQQFTLDYEFSNPEATGTIRLMNAQGQQVLHQSINGYNVKQQFDVSQLPTGLYFVAIQSEGVVLHQSKLMVNQ